VVQYKDYYKVLGVPKTADAKTIKGAYRKKAKELHPDIHPEKAEQFKELNEAFEVLGDADKRQRYDTLGSNWKAGAGSGSPYGGGADPFGAGAWEDLFSGMGGRGGGGAAAGGAGFSDFFDMFFGQGGAPAGRGGAGPHPRQGPERRSGRSGGTAADRKPQSLDEEQALHVSLEDVLQGAQRSLYRPNQKQEVHFKVPKGIEAGKRIRLKGYGKANPQQAGAFGDLYLTVAYQPHPTFSVEGRHLKLTLSLPPWHLVLGGPATLPTLGGGSLSMQIPAGSQAGQKLRIKGYGLPAAKEAEPAGDLQVQLAVALPKTPSPQEKALYEQLKVLAAGNGA
jgi:curved DNA-binding protein